MKLRREVALELMSLADGELHGDAALRAQAELENEPVARELVAALRDPRIGGFLKRSMDDEASKAGVDTIADGVMARLAASPSVAPRRGKRAGLRRIVPPWAQASAAFALAAGLAVYVAANRTSREPVSQQAEPRGTAALESSALGGGVELHEIDALSEVSVFEISGDRRARAGQAPPSSLVIWIEDEAEVEKGP
jgi:hypothetical protein